MIIIAVVRDEVKHNMLLANKLRNEMFDIKKDNIHDFKYGVLHVKKVL